MILPHRSSAGAVFNSAATCRGMLSASGSSSSDESDSDSVGSSADGGEVIIGEDDDVELDPAEWGVGAAAGRPDADATLQMVNEATSRLAVVDLDWSRMRAVDVFAVLQSFVAGRGALRRVVVYVSDYGAREMAREKARGPRGLAHDSVRFLFGAHRQCRTTRRTATLVSSQSVRSVMDLSVHTGNLVRAAAEPSQPICAHL
jgi:hypothetical protein